MDYRHTKFGEYAYNNRNVNGGILYVKTMKTNGGTPFAVFYKFDPHKDRVAKVDTAAGTIKTVARATFFSNVVSNYIISQKGRVKLTTRRIYQEAFDKIYNHLNTLR